MIVSALINPIRSFCTSFKFLHCPKSKLKIINKCHLIEERVTEIFSSYSREASIEVYNIMFWVDQTLVDEPPVNPNHGDLKHDNCNG